MKKFDIVGIGHPCVDYAIHIDALPKPDQGKGVQEGSWQGGGVVPTGLVSASRCGLKAALVGAMGDDLFGRFCYNDFVDHGIDMSHALVREGGMTDIGVIISEDETHGRNILYRRGNYKHLELNEIDLSFLEEAEYLYIASADEMHVALAKYAREHGMKVLIDASGGHISRYEAILPYIDYFVASEYVYNSTFDNADYEKNLQSVRDMGPSTVVFTFGSKGARGLDSNGFCEVPAFHIDVKDTVGAGDTFHGAFFYGLTHNYTLAETIRFASAVSAIKCTCMGGRAGIPTEDVTLKFIETGIIDRSELDKRVEKYSWGLSNVAGETHFENR